MTQETVIDCIKNDATISTFSRYLKKHGMLAAAVYYKNLNETIDRRSSRAFRYLMETMPVPVYEKGQVVFANYKYKCSKLFEDESPICHMIDTGMVKVDVEKFKQLSIENPQEAELNRIIIENYENESHKLRLTPSRWLHGGIHHIPDYPFIINNGLESYRKMAEEKLETETDYEKIQFQLGMLDLIAGIEIYIKRYLETLLAIPEKDEKLQNLINALKQVPMKPARNFYEAYLSLCIIMYFSGDYQEPGRIDHTLGPFYENDTSVDAETAQYYLRELFSDTEKRLRHGIAPHITIGGSKPDGSPDYNELTVLCIKAIGGLRTPNMTLRVCSDMPQAVWDVALYNLGKGYAQPALCNENIYINGLVNQFEVPIEDAVDYVFGGCSETMIQGKTFCDSTWLNYNVLDVFENVFLSDFENCNSYDDFYKNLLTAITFTVKEACSHINLMQHSHGTTCSYPFRSLFTDSCIEKGTRYSNGGTKYSFDNSNIFGTTNTTNALYILRRFYEGEFGDLSKAELLDCLAKNYVGYESLHKKLLRMPKFGNYNEEIQTIAHDLVQTVSDEFRKHRCYRGNGFFMPAVILFNKWELWGRRLGATIDGRIIGEAMADSIGPMQGTDKEGPTSTLGAVLSLPLENFAGTAVTNLRLDQKNFSDKNSIQKIQLLFQSFFEQGGCQLQVTVVDKEILLDALINPEKHQDIIVRVGGFSDNFIHLREELKHEIVRRTEH